MRQFRPHAKIAVRKDIARGYQFESVSNLAYSYSRCSHYLMFEVQENDFPKVLKINNDEPFLVKCFGFYYEEKKKRILPECDHECREKDTCKHSCCKEKEAECVIVKGIDR